MELIMKLILCALLCSAGAAGASAQTISVERERVLGVYGIVEADGRTLQPTALGPGPVATETVTRAGAGAIRLHFTIAQRGVAGAWSVLVRSGNRQWEYAPPADEAEFWSDEMPGDSAVVVVMSSVARPGVQLTIDRLAISVQPSVPKSITFPDEREPWDTVQEPFRSLGRSVVRLRFVDDARQKVFVCTGWLVFNSRHLLTNDHCINSVAEMRSALADVDFNQGTTPARSVRFRRLLLSDPGLDFSLLELDQPLDRPALSLGGAPVVGKQAVAIVQHPAGEPKQLSERGCLVSLASVSGITADPTDFEHACDTLGGSSGSPVFDRATLQVVGLHHLGFLPGDKPVNRAVHISGVLAKIRKNFPELVK
jgi:V8-like Glu-specific endopeptidase